MVKLGFWDDIFEKLAELGQSTAQKTGQAMKQTFSPIKIIESALGTKQSFSDRGIEQLEKGKGKKQTHTPLDFQKLTNKYEEQDAKKAQTLRQRLFQLVKSGEEKTLMAKKQEEQEKKRQEFYQLQEKKRKEEEKRRQEQTAQIPMGKIRRSIFSPKKVAKRKQAEVKPASGKQ